MQNLKFKIYILTSKFSASPAGGQIPNSRGQSLIGLLLTIAVGAIVLILGAQIIQASLKVEEATRQRVVAFQLAREAFEATKVIAEDDWHNVCDATADSENCEIETDGTKYYLYNSSNVWTLQTDVQYETITLGQDSYARWLIFSNVSRDDNGDIESSYNADHDDPSTRKITVYVKHGNVQRIEWSYYLTRWQNEIASQLDWSGGAGENFSNQYSEKSGIITSTPNEITLEMQ